MVSTARYLCRQKLMPMKWCFLASPRLVKLNRVEPKISFGSSVVVDIKPSTLSGNYSCNKSRNLLQTEKPYFSCFSPIETSFHFLLYVWKLAPFSFLMQFKLDERCHFRRLNAWFKTGFLLSKDAASLNASNVRSQGENYQGSNNTKIRKCRTS